MFEFFKCKDEQILCSKVQEIFFVPAIHLLLLMRPSVTNKDKTTGTNQNVWFPLCVEGQRLHQSDIRGYCSLIIF